MQQSDKKHKLFQHSLVWLRRDLRLDDHPALFQAIQNSEAVSLVFIFDQTILSKLDDDDRRLSFIWQSLEQIQAKIRQHLPTFSIICAHGDPVELLPKICKNLAVDCIFTHDDYEPQAMLRDASIAKTCKDMDIAFNSCRDHVLTPHTDLYTKQDKRFTVFTPYKNAVLAYLKNHPENLEVIDVDFKLLIEKLENALNSLNSENLLNNIEDLSNLINLIDVNKDSIEKIGFKTQELLIPVGLEGAEKLWQDFKERLSFYHHTRDYPAIKGVSYLSTHLRFGTIGIRQLASLAYQGMPENPKEKNGESTWFAELLWRDFFSYILYHFSYVTKGLAFNAAYQDLPWENNLEFFQAWCEGNTGFTIVDAGMRQLNQTGYMHNRLRMICASFLVKDLNIDWRWGEAYFAKQLLDFDLSSNNGGWQWAASTGCDPQPYFRIFNPHLQGQKFDSDGKFIIKYIPELKALQTINPDHLHDLNKVPPLILDEANIVLGRDYPHPLINHQQQKDLTLKKFEAAAKKAKINIGEQK